MNMSSNDKLPGSIHKYTGSNDIDSQHRIAQETDKIEDPFKKSIEYKSVKLSRDKLDLSIK